MLRAFLFFAIPAMLVMTGAVCAQAPAGTSRDAYPRKPIRLIVPNPAGGGVDIIARLVGRELEKRLGQSIIVDNRAGAGGTIGIDILAKSPPDGYTLGMGVTATLAIAPSLYSKLPYDTQTDLQPIALIATLPLVLAVHPSLPVKSIKDIVDLAKQRPGQLTYSSTGNGTPTHLAAELFKTLAGVNMVHVPYKGGPPAVQAVTAGEVPLTFGTALTTLPQIRNGRLRVLAVTSSRRSGILPDTPSMSEAGVPGYLAVQWYGVIAPAGIPVGIVVWLNREIRQVIQLSEVKAPLLAEGAELSDTTPEQFRTFIRTEAAKWGVAVKSSGARID